MLCQNHLGLIQPAWDLEVIASCRYVDEEGIVTLKGRVAATIQSSDELVLTELIFNSGFKARVSTYRMRVVSALLHSCSFRCGELSLEAS